jgi:hypothetical protein
MFGLTQQLKKKKREYFVYISWYARRWAHRIN